MNQSLLRAGVLTFAAWCGTLAAGPVAAADNPRMFVLAGDISWQSLSPDEQKALEQYRGQWKNYDTARQKRIRDGARRYLSLPPDQRRELDKQHSRYEHLSPDEQRRLKQEYQKNSD